MINLARLFNRDVSGLYPKLVLRGESIIRQGIDADMDEHDIWLDWIALMKECLLRTDFSTRQHFLNTYAKIKEEMKWAGTLNDYARKPTT